MPQIDRRQFLQSVALGAAALPAAAAAPPAYALVDGGYEIVNGSGVYNRPLPPSHARDKVSRAERFIIWAGDRPDLRFTSYSTRPATVAELRFSLNGKRLAEFETVRARYRLGLYEYTLTSGSATVRLSLVAAVEFEGVLVKFDLPPDSTLTFDIGPGAVQQEGTGFALRNEARKREVHGSAGVPIELAPANDNQTRGTLHPPAGTLYLYFGPSAQEPTARAFDDSVAQLHATAQAIEIHTPDRQLDALVSEFNLSLDRAWHDSTVMHGVYAWHVALAGWRSLYGHTVAGRHDRVQSHAARYFAEQVTEPELPPNTPPSRFGEAPACRGAIPGYLGRKSYFYNMGEVLLDMVFYDWLWTADLDFMSRHFDAIAAKLLWQDRCLDPDGDGLYENWLNAWNTDSKWHNGGGCIISTAYTWRANAMMADIAKRLGRDPTPFQARAEKIRKAANDVLWIPAKGVYAEYKDALGLKRLHESPDLSSIYTPIDVGMCDELQAYQMLRYTEESIPDIKLPGGARLLYSSNWLPELYSTHGLYPAETINTILCYFRIGLTKEAYALLDGIKLGAMLGPCPGSVGAGQMPDGTTPGHIGFSDVVSTFQRTIIEGLFGIQMNVPDGLATFQPVFPSDWPQASLRLPELSLDYAHADTTDRFTVTTTKKLGYRFRLPARSSEVKAVTVNGTKAEFRAEPGINTAWIVIEAPPATRAEVVVVYGAEPLPSLSLGATRRTYDPKRALSAERKAGWVTYFDLVEHRNVTMWIPVESAPPPPEFRRFLMDPPPRFRTIPVSIAAYCNQDLATLHQQRYVNPHTPNYTMTVEPNGRSWWLNRVKQPEPHLDLLAAGGIFVGNLPFKTHGTRACFVSLYDNFPSKLTIPVNAHASDLYFLLAVSTNQMQSRIENARIYVDFVGGEKTVALINPENIDDWLTPPFALSGDSVPLGKGTWARMIAVDLYGTARVRSVTLECLSNEVLCGLLGLTRGL